VAPQQQWQQPSAAQPQQQWQQPGAQYPQQGPYAQQPGGYAQPGQYPYAQAPGAYAPPGYYQQPVAGYSTSALAAVAGVVLLVFGLIDLVGGFWLLGQGAELRNLVGRITSLNVLGINVDREMMRAVLSPLPGVLMGLGVVELLVAVGVFAHKSWGRILGILIALLGILVSIAAVTFSLALAPGASIQVIGSVVILLGYAFVFLALLAGGSHFRRRYPNQR
jgi:hypothetical protein